MKNQTDSDSQLRQNCELTELRRCSKIKTKIHRNPKSAKIKEIQNYLEFLQCKKLACRVWNYFDYNFKSGFVREKSNRFRFSAETKLRVETLLLTIQKSKQRLTIGSEKSGMEVTNRQRSNEFGIKRKRNFGTRKSEMVWDFESGEYLRKNLKNLNKNWMSKIGEDPRNPESGKM